jgi:tetratricopeptide (TPR) repeat protein
MATRKPTRKPTRNASAWSRFPYEAADYAHDGVALERAWPGLHKGDCEPWPDARRVAALLRRHPAARPQGAAGHDEAALARALQDAWRAFHRGDFEAAWQAGAALGGLGASAAVKAAGIYAVYLEEHKPRAEKLLLAATELAAAASEAAPSDPNAHYFHAFALGRYSQRISVLAALAAGHATRIRRSLDRALELKPTHADAHLALGVYHAEIVGKLGALPAKLSYGASAQAALEHFERAVHLNPEAPVTHIEFANGLLALYGEQRHADAVRRYERAAACRPRDAMERLDVEQARAELA